MKKPEWVVYGAYDGTVKKEPFTKHRARREWKGRT